MKKFSLVALSLLIFYILKKLELVYSVFLMMNQL